MPEFKVDSALLCDDIRREDNGKYLLVGVYSGGIRFGGDFPAQMAALCAFLVIRSDIRKLELDFRARKAGAQKNILGGGAEFERIQGAPEGSIGMELPLKFQRVKFDEPGRYNLQIRLRDRQWKTVLSFDVARSQEPDAPQ